MIKPYETINSFTRRPVISQIVAYLVFIGEALTFFICMYVNFTSSARQIAILVLYIVTVIIQVVVTFITSYIDPSDSVMIEFKNNAKNRRNMDVQDCLFCDFCTSYVKQTSRHCKICQRRCVEKFDHHCMWINNCIGIKNYRVFIAMIIFTFVNMIVYVIGMILLWTEDGWKQYIGPMVAIWVYSVIMLVFAVLLLNLICLHMYLIYKGFTTYQFIMQQRDQVKKKKNEKSQKQKLKDFQSGKNRKTSIEQEMSVKPSSSSEEASSSQNSSSSLNNKISVMSKRFQNQQNDFKSDGTSSIMMNENKNVLENILRTEKSQEESTYQAKKIQVRNNTIFVNSQLSQQKEEEIQEVDNENLENISNFFTKNKSLKFLIGTQVGDRPKSAIISNNLYQNHFLNVGDSSNNNEIQVNKSMCHSRNLNNKSIIKKTSTSLKAVHFKQNYTPNKSNI